MIARIWRGRTPRALADAYADFLRRRALPDYRSVATNRGAMVLRSDRDDHSEFMTISFWDNEDDIRAFAGPDVLNAKYYPEDDRFLLWKVPFVAHFSIVGQDHDAVRCAADEPACAAGQMREED